MYCVCRHLESILDERSATLVTRYLASSRALSKSFDVYLQQVMGFNSLFLTQWHQIRYVYILPVQLIRVLSEPEVRMRTRAMKALSSIIDADPSILSRVSLAMYTYFCSQTNPLEGLPFLLTGLAQHLSLSLSPSLPRPFPSSLPI